MQSNEKSVCAICIPDLISASLFFHNFHGNGYLRDKFRYVARDSVVDERYFTRKSDRLESVFAYKFHYSPILRGRFGVTSAKTHGNARSLGENCRFAVKNILVVKHEKYPVIAVELSRGKIFCRYADPDLSEKYHRFRVGLFELSYRRFHIEKTVYFERIRDPDDPARRHICNFNSIKLGAARAVEHIQAVVNFSLYARNLFALFSNLVFLPKQLFFDYINIAVAQKVGYFRERHIQRAQIAYRIQHLELPHAVIAVTRLRVGIFGRKKPCFFVVPQAAFAYMEKPRRVAYFYKFTFQLWRPPFSLKLPQMR